MHMLTQRRRRSRRMESPRALQLPNANTIHVSTSFMPLTPAQEHVFLHMQHRRLTRHLKGTQRKAKNTHHVALFILLLCVYGLSASYMDQGTLTTTLTIRVWQMVAVGAWFLLIVILLSLLEGSTFFAAIVWMFVYWPLLAIITSILVTGNADMAATATWITTVFVLAQALTACIVVWRHYVYPKTLQSDWFAHKVGAGWFWTARLLVESTTKTGAASGYANDDDGDDDNMDDGNDCPHSSWTMTYEGSYHWTQLLGHTHRHTCQYQGDVHPESGLPHGSGRWMDDSHGGEILTGAWHHGKPVAPFLSRQYGTGDAFRAVPIAWFLAADDGFAQQKLIPTNAQPARCGVASVECSVQGAFYNHLPEAREFYGPVVVPELQDELYDDTGERLQDCFRHMVQLMPEYDTGRSITVTASDPRGIQVLGHVFAPTNLPFSTETSEVVVTLKRGCQYDDDDDDDDDDGSQDEAAVVTEKLLLEDIELGSIGNKQALHDVSSHKKQSPSRQDPRATRSVRPNFARLEVQDWLPSPRKEALVFVPGFNCCLKRSLQTLGQLLAMTKISSRVFPIVFEWPVGQVLTYRYASAIAASDRNRKFFLQLMRGLSAAGIDHVHLVSHSMGVQTLLGAFENKTDGTPSDVSQCFRLAGDDANVNAESLMTCKSITMLNPDFPLAAFVDHAFLSIRRICDHITIVGDRGDQALFYSQLINGIAKRYGYSQPGILDGKTETSSGFHQQVMGRHIDRLHAPENLKEVSDKHERLVAEESVSIDHRMLFQKRQSQMSMATNDGTVEHRWLDVDVIDTTLLDTNIKDLRHSGFNVNPILLKDLEELILTGRRAAERSTLLYREGNVFSYCHAPSFVTM